MTLYVGHAEKRLCHGGVMGKDIQVASVREQEIDHECTSWLAFSDVLKNDTVILHKNRDSKNREVGCVMGNATAKRHWLGMGDCNVNNPCMGMNDNGLMGVMNSGELCTDNGANPKATKTPGILKAVLATCDTAVQAVECLKGFIERNDYYHNDRGSIFFFMDAREAYIVEITAHFMSPQRYDHGFAYRANIWHNHDMASYSINTVTSFLDSCHREYVVKKTLSEIIRSNGCLTVNDCLKLSRNHQIMPESKVESRVCNERTNSACTMELELSSPDVLSTMWALLGHPCHTIQIPIPICTTAFTESMRTSAWAGKSYQRMAEQGPFGDIPQAWLDFEEMTFAQYRETQNQARELLKQHNKAAAIKLLNETAAAIWDKAAKLLEIQ